MALTRFNDDKCRIEKKLQESSAFQIQYELNRKIIDFNYIPEELVNEFMNSATSS